MLFKKVQCKLCGEILQNHILLVCIFNDIKSKWGQIMGLFDKIFKKKENKENQIENRGIKKTWQMQH